MAACLSVTHKPVLCQNGWTDLARFLLEGLLRLYVGRKFVYLQTKGTFREKYHRIILLRNCFI